MAIAAPRSSTPFGPWPISLAARDAVVLDLETTGGSARHDRIVEIAVVRVRNGRVAQRWRTLVNPGVAIPPFITGLTGISSGMVASAPSFADVVERLLAFVGDAVLVAHQASFDAGFLREELRRLGRADVPADVLCTVKLSRRLLPGLPSHSLEALIQALDLPERRRHRALPDALATSDLLVRLVQQAVDDGLQDWDDLIALANGPKRKRVAPTFERARLKELPTGPGVYLLKDSDANIFYVGKSVNLRRRVREHVRGTSEGQPRLRRQLKQLADVQVISTASELEALLLEAKLIKRYLPVANQQLRDETHYPFIRVDVQNDFPRLEVTRLPQDDGAVYFGPFRSARMVGAVVDYLRGALGIRECTRPLPDGQSCLLYDLKKCLAPCIGAVDAPAYRASVDRALELLRGEWTEILDGIEARMLQLAELEEFEKAAELRDTLSRLRTLVKTQQRLAEMAAYHAVIVTQLGDDRAQLFFVQAGRL
ncbi:MAG: polymerase subunit epsilon, partial [Chloroflexota bacterium]|nr:polymerase subunit epsilon [Chloroflexota bacterium]